MQGKPWICFEVCRSAMQTLGNTDFGMCAVACPPRGWNLIAVRETCHIDAPLFVVKECKALAWMDRSYTQGSPGIHSDVLFSLRPPVRDHINKISAGNLLHVWRLSFILVILVVSNWILFTSLIPSSKKELLTSKLLWLRFMTQTNVWLTEQATMAHLFQPVWGLWSSRK